MATEVLLRNNPWTTKFQALLSDLGVAVFIPLFLSQSNRFVHFHARQGLALWTILILAIGALFLPGSGKFIFVALMGIYLVSTVIGILSVLTGNSWEIPLIGSVARRYL